jgi:hypothetical protein
METDTEVTTATATVETKKGRGRPKKYFNYPKVLTCSMTGKQTKTNPTQLHKQILASGKSLEEFLKTYICKSAKKSVAEGKIRRDPVTGFVTHAPVNPPLQEIEKLEELNEVVA